MFSACLLFGLVVSVSLVRDASRSLQVQIRFQIASQGGIFIQVIPTANLNTALFLRHVFMPNEILSSSKSCDTVYIRGCSEHYSILLTYPVLSTQGFDCNNTISYVAMAPTPKGRVENLGNALQLLWAWVVAAMELLNDIYSVHVL